MSADFLVESDDEADVLLTRATSTHVRHLVVDGRDVVRNGSLTGADLADIESELMARARKVALIPPDQPPRNRRRREAVPRYYADRHHLAEPPGRDRT